MIYKLHCRDLEVRLGGAVFTVYKDGQHKLIGQIGERLSSRDVAVETITEGRKKYTVGNPKKRQGLLLKEEPTSIAMCLHLDNPAMTLSLETSDIRFKDAADWVKLERGSVRSKEVAGFFDNYAIRVYSGEDMNIVPDESGNLLVDRVRSSRRPFEFRLGYVQLL